MLVSAGILLLLLRLYVIPMTPPVSVDHVYSCTKASFRHNSGWHFKACGQYSIEFVDHKAVILTPVKTVSNNDTPSPKLMASLVSREKEQIVVRTPDSTKELFFLQPVFDK